MKIYDHPALPNPLRVRMALAEKGLSRNVEFETVDIMTGEHRDPSFLEKNPSGTVPVLELEDGSLISECTAITEYLDHLDDDPVLTGKTPAERAHIHMMQRRAEAGLLDAVSDYFHHATPGLGPELETDQVPQWGERQRQKALRNMAYLDGILRDQPYLAGVRFTVADITAFAGLAFADAAKIEIPADLTALIDWRARVEARQNGTA